jgi:hypothetical protein
MPNCIILRRLGRFGNQIFRYSYARALSEATGMELFTEPWIGESVFSLGGKTHARPESALGGVEIDEYRQSQKDLIYTKSDCLRWFDLKPEIKARVRGYALTGQDSGFVHCHRRVGDYRHLNYPIISMPKVRLRTRTD